MNTPVKLMRPLSADELYRHLQTLDSVQAYQYGKDCGIEAGWMKGTECVKIEYQNGWAQGLIVGVVCMTIALVTILYGHWIYKG